ncbi:MAG: SpoIIE family protein phosphatase [Spirochaetaceae bacterium]|nr:SpoIIE family protein phosphatase [Spirochaetaceae bacterium]
MLLLFFIPVANTNADIFWDSQRVIIPSNARFHSVAYGGGSTVILWHEFIRHDANRGVVFLSIATTSDGIDWVRNERFAGPFSFAGDEVPISSLAVDDDGYIYIAASVGANNVRIYSSSDNGISFTHTTHQATIRMAVGPRLFIKEDGTFIMFATQEVGTNLSIFFSMSDDGVRWGDFRQLIQEPGLALSFLPHFVSKDGVEYVIFQSLVIERRATYQLHLMRSTNGGRTWGAPRRITDFGETITARALTASDFDNQRPHFLVEDDKIKLVWERRNINEANPQIYYAELDLHGNLLEPAERVSRDNRSCHFPRITSYLGTNTITWFDNRRGDFSIIFAEFTGILWRERVLSPQAGSSTFGQLVALGESISIFWENRVGNTSRIVMVGPKLTVDTPVIRPVNFTANRRAALDRFTFSWNIPPDPLGIAGFSYIVGRDPLEEPPRRIMNTAQQLTGEVTVTEDGPWYISLIATDFAGNWSRPAVMPIFRDTEPPGKVVIEDLMTDSAGFVFSNTFRVNWELPDPEPLSGYIYNFQLLDENYRRNIDDETLLRRIRPPGRENIIDNSFIDVSAVDNGIWGLSVAAVDQAGNIGEATQVILRLNKYIPVTFITSVDATRDLLDRITISIRGRGFSVGGNIRSIILDRDGEEPWDYVFHLNDGAYRVDHDRLITNFTVYDVLEGEYMIGLIHPTRGIYFTRPVIRLEPSGNVKLGHFVSEHRTIWKPVKRNIFVFNLGGAGFYLVLALCFFVVMISTFRIRAAYTEGKQLEKDIYAIMKGIPISDKGIKEGVMKIKNRGMGLRLKFTLFIILIVFGVVLMIALPLARFMLETERRNLVTGLHQQVGVLLESLTHSARAFMPAANMLELGLLPSQRDAMADAVYVTISGRGPANEEIHDFLWVTDDPNIFNKIDSREIVAGRDRISDSVSPLILELERRINEEAFERVSGYSHEIDRLGEQAIRLVGRAGTEAELGELQGLIREYDQIITRILREIGREIYSYPHFDIHTYDIQDTVYTFYKPIIYRMPGDDIFFRGVVRLGVSTSRIIAETRNSNIILIRQTAITAAIAVVFGIVGALILAAIIISPIRKLVKGLEIIRDTEDKEQLKDHIIQIKSRDEIFLLAETINQMTKGLVKAAAASKDLTVGKEIQKMFIPLEKDSAGNKRTTGKEDTDKFEFFGYYEGAKGVSGDYFDYLKLDDDNYALIKCDVAGKGVPASLIMVEVATIFLNHFRNWNSKQKINLSEVVININDMLEERGFKGRFATLIIVIINIATGESYLCNAGDSIVHFYSKKENKMKQIALPESPASGVFPSVMVSDKFQQVKMKVDKGDAFLLFTDGIEESKRMFRNKKFKEIICSEPGLKEGEMHGNHSVGAGSEELGINRVYDILNAVFSKSIYRLEKYHNPIENEQLTFDFASCKGTMEEAIMAMVSVEKIFRIILDPSATSDNKISIDKKVNDFLKLHFDQYRRFFAYPVEIKENVGYDAYSNLKEDEQYDDLTILAFRRK